MRCGETALTTRQPQVPSELQSCRMAKQTQMQLHTSEHGDAGSDGVQDRGSTPLASTTQFQSQVLHSKRLRFLFAQKCIIFCISCLSKLRRILMDLNDANTPFRQGKQPLNTLHPGTKAPFPACNRKGPDTPRNTSPVRRRQPDESVVLRIHLALPGVLVRSAEFGLDSGRALC